LRPARVARDQRQRGGQLGNGADRRRTVLLVDRARQAVAGSAQRGHVPCRGLADRHGLLAQPGRAHPARRRHRAAGPGHVRAGVPPLGQGRPPQGCPPGVAARRSPQDPALGGVPMSSLSRREFLALAALGIAAVTVASCGRGEGIEQTAELLTSEAAPPKPFAVPLPVPEVKTPVRSDATPDYYEITERVADVEILPGRPTPV